MQQKSKSAYWKKLKLDMASNGTVAKTYMNVWKILNNDPEIEGKIRLNTVDERIHAYLDLPWNTSMKVADDDGTEFFTKYDKAQLYTYIADHIGWCNKEFLDNAIKDIAAKKYYNPRKDYFDNLKWDNVPRLERLFVDYLGAEDDDYTRYLLLMAVFKYAIANDRLTKNPMNKIKSPKVQQKNPTVIKKEDIEGMLSDLAERNLKLYIPVAISVLFGLRRGETVGLKWENVILESSETYPHGYLIVRATATNDFDNGEKVTINNTTKTGKIRAIAISEKTNLIFRHIKEKEAENKKVAGNAWHSEWDGFVCRDELGDLATPDYISSAWTNYRDHYLSAKNSAYKNVRFHDLRHTAATIIYETTADMQLVQKILGHSTITTTVDLPYGHTTQSRRYSIIQGLSLSKAAPHKEVFASFRKTAQSRRLCCLYFFSKNPAVDLNT